MLPNLKIFNRYDRNGRDLEKNSDLNDDSSSQSQSNSESNQNEEEENEERESNMYECSDIFYEDKWE